MSQASKNSSAVLSKSASSALGGISSALKRGLGLRPPLPPIKEPLFYGSSGLENEKKTETKNESNLFDVRRRMRSRRYRKNRRNTRRRR